MAIDRTNYNALVDDDGSNTVGTDWSKNQVKIVVLDPIDALVGDPTAVAFASGNFTASGAQTWTVILANQLTLSYTKIGKTLTVFFFIQLTTVGGTPSTDLRIALPAGLVVASTVSNPFTYFDNGTFGTGQCEADATVSYIRLLKASYANWSAASGATSVYGQITIPTTT